ASLDEVALGDGTGDRRRFLPQAQSKIAMPTRISPSTQWPTQRFPAATTISATAIARRTAGRIVYPSICEDRYGLTKARAVEVLHQAYDVAAGPAPAAEPDLLAEVNSETVGSDPLAAVAAHRAGTDEFGADPPEDDPAAVQFM